MKLGRYAPWSEARAWPSRRILMMGVAMFAACGGASPGDVTGTATSTPQLTVVRVSLSADTIPVGQRVTATAVGLDQYSGAVLIPSADWTTTSPEVATVSASGVVSAVAPGRTMVVATVNGKLGQVPLTVVQIPVVQVVVSPGTVRVARGVTVQLSASTLDFSGHVLLGRAVVWSSSDAAKAAVTSTGVVTTYEPGDVRIIATSEGASGSAELTVTAVEDSVASVTVSPATASLVAGETLQLTATLRDKSGTPIAGRIPAWSVTSVAGGNVATVSATGLLTAISPGSVIVQALSEGQHGSATISVMDNVDKTIVVSFASPDVNELIGDTLRVYIGVTSAHPISSVVATVGSVSTTLKVTPVGALGGSHLWVGSIDLTDLASGVYQVLATATDSRGARGVGSRQFQRDTRVGKGGSSDAPKVK